MTALRHAVTRRIDGSGSALIVVLVLAAVLSVMGLALLTLTEHQQRIAAARRDRTQLADAAEAAATIVRGWFDDPAEDHPLRPTASEVRLDLRRGAVFGRGVTQAADETNTPDHESVRGAAGNGYAGGLVAGARRLFTLPTGTEADTFWGRLDSPDVLLCTDADLDLNGDGSLDCLEPGPVAYLERLSDFLTASGDASWEGVTVELIALSRPPLDFDREERRGLATLDVVVTKSRAERIVARRHLRQVVERLPRPRPRGPIESDGPLSESALRAAHWGPIVSGSDLALPTPDATFPPSTIPRASRGALHPSLNPASRVDLHPAIPSTRATALTELVGRTAGGVPRGAGARPPCIADPWLSFATAGAMTVDGASLGPRPHPRPYGGSAAGGDLTGTVHVGAPRIAGEDERNWSQLTQGQDVRPTTLSYSRWKAIAQSTDRGLRYFEWAGSERYREDGRGPARHWLDWIEADRPGVFFFDTRDGSPPAQDGGNLTPPHSWRPGSQVTGILLLHASELRLVARKAGRPVLANLPGEPFLDDGLDLVDASGRPDGCACVRVSSTGRCEAGVRPARFGLGVPCPQAVLQAMDPDVARREASTYRNGRWDADLDGDGVPDERPLAAGGSLPAHHGAGGGLLPHGRAHALASGGPSDPRFLEDLAPTARRPVHEPFLNIDYASPGRGSLRWSPDLRSCAARVDFAAAGELVRGRHDRTLPERTTDWRDPYGPLVELPADVEGVLQVEGAIVGSGGIGIIGAVLPKAGFHATGDSDIWYDPRLGNGDHPPTSWRLPRLHVVSTETQ